MAEHDRQGWQEIAREDPAWAVLSLPRGKRGGWDAAPLQRTGQQAVTRLLGLAADDVGAMGTALAVDVGCGVGRLTAALADRFDRVVGLDVTPAMLEAARAALADRPQVTVLEADVAHHVPAEATGADVVVSERVLQHLPAADVPGHVRGLVALLRPGGVAVVQVPTRLPWAVRLQPRRRAYRVLRRLGASPRVLYWRLGLHPMSMRAVPVAELATAAAGVGRVVGVHEQFEPAFGVEEAVVVLQREPVGRAADAGGHRSPPRPAGAPDATR